MDLIKIKHYLQQRELTQLNDIALHFRTDIDTLQPMLDIWIRKGKIKKHQSSQSCGRGCRGCDSQTVIAYEWIKE